MNFRANRDDRSEHPFDHVAIGARDALPAAADAYRRLGFIVTPLGKHTLGSLNHLIVLGTTYLELIGYAPGDGERRPELRDAPPGLNGLVMRSDDAELTRERVSARGVPLSPVQRFSRPVDLGDGAPAESRPDAVFRTVRALPGHFPSGRVYFCEHLTPEWVWRDPWRAHPNGATELIGATVEAREPDAEAARWAALLGATRVHRVGDADRDAAWRGRRVIDPHARHVVDIAPLTLSIGPGAVDRMSGLCLAVVDAARTGDWLAAAGLACRKSDAGLMVTAADAGGVDLQFRA